MSYSCRVLKSYSFVFFLGFFIIAPWGLHYSLGSELLMEWEFLSVGPCSMVVPVFFDKASVLFSSVVLIISSMVLYYSFGYIGGDSSPRRFALLIFLFVLRINLLIFIPSVVGLIVGWDGLGLTSFCLVIYYQRKKSLAAGMITAIMNRVGDGLLVSLIGAFMCFGHWRILYCENSMGMLAVFVMIAAATKSAQIPFCSWLPAAMAAPTPVSALVHSSTLVTAGVYLLIRFHPLFVSRPLFKPGCLILGVSTSVLAGLAALVENDLKKVVALSTLRQLGLLFCSLALIRPMVCLFHLIVHALFKSLLFLSVGNIIHMHGGSQDLRYSGALFSQLPVSSAGINVANLAISGVPFLAAFYSKDIIVHSTILIGYPVLILLVFFFSLGLTASYSFRLSYYLLWGPTNYGPFGMLRDSEERAMGPIRVLTASSVVGGAIFIKLLAVKPIVVILPKFLFVVPVVSLFLGCLLGALVVGVFRWRPWVFFFDSFLIRMWFFKGLSTGPVVRGSLFLSGVLSKRLDYGWNEKLISKGPSLFLVDFSFLNLGVQVGLIKSLISGVGVGLFVCCVLV